MELKCSDLVVLQEATPAQAGSSPIGEFEPSQALSCSFLVSLFYAGYCLRIICTVYCVTHVVRYNIFAYSKQTRNSQCK